MKDKSITLLNSSLLMHWVADYEKSVSLIKQAEIVLNQSGIEIKLDEEHQYQSLLENNDKLKYIELTDNQSNETSNPSKKATSYVNEKLLNAREISLESSNNSGLSIPEEKKRNEYLIVSQARILYNISQKAKSLYKKRSKKQQENDPFVTSHSEKLSCLLIRTDILKYEIRVVVNVRFDWNEDSFNDIEIEGYRIDCTSCNSHESVFYIENRRISGEVHFSSLGLGEGKFYEQQGVHAPDRSELLILIMKNLAQEVFSISGT
ncbi:hypothetical protein [Paenibacillus sp. DR312]|uniref:hypothetical protein n=1 Tax=Paenibacillus sp. DR312 TaxID=2871175 RepID=UPI001C947004|nr:hypothetical protein [Paenibacillus sp. DR312]QZN75463.1 hypothetical protein K5K90_29580 [Paenibacillus sp. DR312]